MVPWQTMRQTVEPMQESRALRQEPRWDVVEQFSTLPPASTRLLGVFHGRDDPQGVPRPRSSPPRPRAPRPPEGQAAAAQESDQRAFDDFTLRIVVDYCNGATQQQIAARYGVHVQTIRKILRDAGVSVRDHHAVLTRDEIHAIRMAHD